MDMLLIEIYSPSVDRSYDFQISEDTAVTDAISSFCEMITAKTGGVTDGSAEEYSLYDALNRRELDRNRSLKENGILSGMKLILA